MSSEKIIKPYDSKKKILTLVVLSVIAVFTFSYVFYRMGASFIGMLVFMLLCTAPVIGFVIIRIDKNKITVTDDQFQAVQGMSSIVVHFSRVISVTVQQRNLQSPMGPTAISTPMMIFMTDSGEKELMFTQYRTEEISFIIDSLLTCNPNAIVAEDVIKLLNNKTETIEEKLRTKFNYMGSWVSIAIVIIVYLMLTGKLRLTWPW